MSRLAARALPLAVPLLVLFAGACASTGSSTDADIEELKARVIELQKKAAMAEVEIARLRQEVLASRGAAPRPAPPPNQAGGTAAPPAAVAPPSPAPEIPSSPPSPPPAAIEEDDLDAEPAPPPVIAADEPPQPLTPEAQAMYDQAYTLYHQGRYLDAETAFQRFLQLHGRTDLADNASYWIGECRFSRGDLRGALDAFRSTIERYPSGNKIADALLKSGQCLESLGDPESARAVYDELIARFGDSAAAGVARARRDRLP